MVPETLTGMKCEAPNLRRRSGLFRRRWRLEGNTVSEALLYLLEFNLVFFVALAKVLMGFQHDFGGLVFCVRLAQGRQIGVRQLVEICFRRRLKVLHVGKARFEVGQAVQAKALAGMEGAISGVEQVQAVLAAGLKKFQPK